MRDVGKSMSEVVAHEWRIIPGTDGNYLVSDHGQVWSRPRRNTSGGILTPTVTQGYLYVTLSVDGRTQTRRIHRLVLESFVGPANGLECRHLDGDKTNNRLDNLAWGTRSENALDRVRHGTHSTGSKTECIRGHPFDEVNTHIRTDGSRYCRACALLRLHRYRRRLKEGAA